MQSRPPSRHQDSRRQGSSQCFWAKPGRLSLGLWASAALQGARPAPQDTPSMHPASPANPQASSKASKHGQTHLDLLNMVKPNPAQAHTKLSKPPESAKNPHRNPPRTHPTQVQTQVQTQPNLPTRDHFKLTFPVWTFGLQLQCSDPGTHFRVSARCLGATTRPRPWRPCRT